MIRVWDPFIRFYHWSLVGIVVANRFVNETGGDWHERLGVTACVLIGIRILWGFIGSRYARFSEISSRWPARGQFFAHVRDYLGKRTPRYLGHPPLAVIGMSLMLLCILLLGLTGWMLRWDAFFGEDWFEAIHYWISNALLALIAIHVIGVVREGYIHRENLLGSMIHGKKRPEAVRSET